MIDVLPDEGIRFQKERQEILNRDLSRGIPCDEILMFEYLVKYHSDLYRPDEKRLLWYRHNKVDKAFEQNM